MRTDRNWREYARMMKNGELDYFIGKGYYAAFSQGSPVCIAPSEEEALEIAKEQGVKSELMTQLIGSGLQTVTFYRPKGSGFARLLYLRF